MKSVSFKIDVTPEVYDILIDPENWPKSKRIREFIKMSAPKSTLNDFMPANTNGTESKSNDESEQYNVDMLKTINGMTNNGNGSTSSNNNTGSPASAFGATPTYEPKN